LFILHSQKNIPAQAGASFKHLVDKTTKTASRGAAAIFVLLMESLPAKLASQLSPRMRRSPIKVASLAPIKMIGQVVRRYRGLLQCNTAPNMLYALQPYTKRLERQDIFTALVTPANVKPGWLCTTRRIRTDSIRPSPGATGGNFHSRT